MPDVHNMLVETTGDFMFVDVSSNQEIQPHRPTVVKITPFIDIKVKQKKIKILDEDVGDLTDAEYGKEWEEEHAAPKPLKAVLEPKRSENKMPVQGKNEKDENFENRLAKWKEANPDLDPDKQ